MGNGFTVNSAGLVTGGENVTGLQDRCLAIAEDAVASMAAMSGSAGHPGLASALDSAAQRGDGTFAGMWAAYGHASKSLAASAATYDNAEQANIGKIRAINQ